MTIKQESIRMFLAVTALMITAALTAQQESKLINVNVAGEAALITKKAPKQLTKKQIIHLTKR